MHSGHQLTSFQKRFFDAVRIGNIQALKSVVMEAQEAVLELDAVLSNGRFWRATNPCSATYVAITAEMKKFIWEFIESVLVHNHERELLLRWALRTYQSEEIIQELAEECSPWVQTVEGLTVIQEACFFLFSSNG